MYQNGAPPAGCTAGGYPAGPGYMQPASGYGPQHNGYPPPAPHMHYPGAPPWPQHMQPPAAGCQQGPMMGQPPAQYQLPAQYQQQYVQQPYPLYQHPQQSGPYPQSGYPAPHNGYSAAQGGYAASPQGMPVVQPGGMRPLPPPPGQNSSRASSRNSSLSGDHMGLPAAPPQQQAAQASGGQMSISPAPVPASSQQPKQQRAPYAPAIDTAAVQSEDGSTLQGGSAASTPGSASNRGGNGGSVLLAALQNSSRDNAAGSAQSSSTVPADIAGSSGQATAVQVDSTDHSQPVRTSSTGAGQGHVGNSSSGSSSAEVAGKVDARGVYLEGIPPDTTKQQLEAMFAAYGKISNVTIIGVKRHATKCAFVNFASEAAAQQALALKQVKVNNVVVQVKPKVVKVKATATGGVTTSAQAAAQHLATQHRQGAAASSSTGSRQQARLLGDNEQGLPMLRGAACCPFFLGTGACAFRAACKYHHPMHAMHPECVQHGKKPQRYDYIVPASYARLVNFTERLWDYDSCAEAQLKIWLARHLLASENSGCGMFDESAAVPAADEYAAFEDEAQPLGPYSCTMDEADQVLQLLWKAQPDEAAKQVMPYKGKLQALLGDDPYYDLAPDPLSGRMWVRLQVGAIKNLLNF